MPGKVVSQEEWLVARKALLVKEKAATRAADAIAAEIRELPMVKVTQNYTFEGPSGRTTLLDIFEGRKQLVIYHMMFSPEDNEPCSSCAFFTDNIPTHLEHLNSRQTTFAVISRAPYSKIASFKKRMGWTFPWYSSNNTSFNDDFHVTSDPDANDDAVMYNFKTKAELKEAGMSYHSRGEQPGMSIFYTEEKDVYHTYSSYSRGNEKFLVTYLLLDRTPLGRQDRKADGLGFPFHDQYD